MKLEGMKVTHKTFGEGTITEFDKKHITIQFETKTSKFKYPDAFEKFITIENTEIQKEIMDDLAALKNAEEERKAVIRKTIEKEATLPTTKKIKNLEDGFDDNYNVAYLARKPILTSQEVEEQYGIKIAGLDKGINKTSTTIVLISSIDKKKSGFVYHDRWTEDGEYIFSGEGKKGDQFMTSGNKAIASATDEEKTIHLFVKFSPKEYYYQGIFVLVDYTYEDDEDEAGNTRKEYKFRLRKVN